MKTSVASLPRQVSSACHHACNLSSSVSNISPLVCDVSSLAISSGVVCPFDTSFQIFAVAHGKHRAPRMVGRVNVKKIGFFGSFDTSDYCLVTGDEWRSFQCGARLGGAGSGGEVETEMPAEWLSANDLINRDGALVSGSPIVIIVAPVMLKTAEPMPMMRPNRGLLKPGDAGRVIDRRPKDVWAVRFSVGTYLIDRKYFEPLQQ